MLRMIAIASSGVLPIESVPSYSGLGAFDIERLTGLSEGYLSQNGVVLSLTRLKASAARDTSSPTATEGSATILPFNRR